MIMNYSNLLGTPILLPLSDFDFYEWHEGKNGKRYLAIRQDIHTWFSTKGIGYSIVAIEGKEYIHFSKEKNAVLFKLTWI